MQRVIRGLLIAYALTNAVLYSLLLPLWEGFDEPFHFAYVQQLANGQGFPDARSAKLSREVAESFRMAPVSQVVQQNLPLTTSYDQYFAWPYSQRLQIWRALRDLPRNLRWQESGLLNYEAHQPPLAYALLALPERLLSQASLPSRVAILRMLAAASGSLILLVGGRRLLTQLGVDNRYKDVALFCLCSSQMIWATLAHVANDWLALPIAIWLLIAINRFDSKPNTRCTALSATALAVGLLTKAYSLAFVPLLIGLCAWRRRWRQLGLVCLIFFALAGPWYARNILQFGSLSGTQEARGGAGLSAVIHGIFELNWPDAIFTTIRGALWTGNNTFMAFSGTAINIIIGTALAALILWASSRHTAVERITATEGITVTYCILFALALGYATLESHIYTHGRSIGPSPWYAQVLLVPLLGFAALGASRRPRVGRFLAAATVIEFGYLMVATYVVKLIPLYGGFQGRTTLANVEKLYTSQLGNLAAGLDTATLAPAAVLFALTGTVVILAITQQILLIRRIFQRAG